MTETTMTADAPAVDSEPTDPTATAVAAERARWVDALVRESRRRGWCGEFEIFMRTAEPEHVGDWYDSDGLSCRGRDRDGYDAQGIDRNGYNRAGFDRAGFDRDGFNAAGRDRNGRDRSGIWPHADDPYAYDPSGYDREGLGGWGEPLRLTLADWQARPTLPAEHFNRDRYGYTRAQNEENRYTYDPATGDRLNRYGERYN